MLPNFHPAMLGAFKVVTGLYGEPATWHTAPGGPVAGSGLFNEPTQGSSISPHSRNAAAAEYEQAQPTFEYASGQFPGLKEAAADTATDTLLLVRDRVFAVGNVRRKFDGETYEAVMRELLPTPTPTDLAAYLNV